LRGSSQHATKSLLKKIDGNSRMQKLAINGRAGAFMAHFPRHDMVLGSVGIEEAVVPTRGAFAHFEKNMAQKARAWKTEAWKSKPCKGQACKMPAHFTKKTSSLMRKQANFNKRIKQLQPQSIGSLYSAGEQADMLIPLKDIKDAVDKKVNSYAAVRNYMTFEKKMLYHPKSTADYEALFEEMEATEEGYFYYKNIGAGVRKYAHANKVPDDGNTTQYILDNFGKKGMMQWIKHGFM